RVDSGTLRITHDFLATMLGTDRPSVSLAAGLLQRMHIIKYSRGAVKILNHRALETQACECYSIIQRYALLSQTLHDLTRCKFASITLRRAVCSRAQRCRVREDGMAIHSDRGRVP